MANFNLSNFFEAFNSLRAKSTATVKNALSSLKTCSKNNNANQCKPCQYDSQDESPKLDCGCNNQKTQKTGWWCRHTKQQPCQPQPQPTCQPQPQPTCHPQPQPQRPPVQQPSTDIDISRSNLEQYNIAIGETTQILNYGYMGGPGDDTLIMNYTENTFNTSNTFNTNITNTTSNNNTTINNKEKSVVK